MPPLSANNNPYAIYVRQISELQHDKGVWWRGRELTMTTRTFPVVIDIETTPPPCHRDTPPKSVPHGPLLAKKRKIHAHIDALNTECSPILNRLYTVCRICYEKHHLWEITAHFEDRERKRRKRHFALRHRPYRYYLRNHLVPLHRQRKCKIERHAKKGVLIMRKW